MQHKTTHRDLYERAAQFAHACGCDDGLLLNERGFITEASRFNVLVEQAGARYTPPLSAGVLPGVYRAFLLDTDARLAERDLTPEDLLVADRVWLCNALRGEFEARFVSQEEASARARSQAP